MLTSLIAAAALGVPGPIVVDGMLCHPSRLLVKTNNGRAIAALRHDYHVLWQFPEIGWMAIETPVGRLQSTKAFLAQQPGIELVTLDRAAKLAYEPNDQYWPNMWHFRTIKANLAWDSSFGSPTTVAVIDTGVERTHPDLKNNLWVNTGEIPNNGVDDDGNGYIDDINGWDFAYNDNDPNDVYGHGTACAGLVGAVQDNAIGVTGVAPRARIMCLKTAIDEGYLYDTANIPAYMYAAANGARVLSMSYFSDRVSQGERDAIDYDWNHGILPVAAAGNSYSVYPYYPSGYELSLAVAATDESNNKAGFSNYGSWVDVAAPGVNLYSTATGGSYTSGFGGTSGATPHVAGLATLLFGAKPSATNYQVRAAIEDTATLLNQAPYGEFSNYGLINAQAAMQAILVKAAPAKKNIVRYMTPSDVTAPFLAGGNKVIARIYGRSFASPTAPLIVKVGGQTASVVGRSRDWVDIDLPALAGPVTIATGSNLTVISRPPAIGLTYPLIEGSSPGATVLGGFFETLRDDGVPLRCSLNGDGIVSLQATFRKVRLGSTNVELYYTRKYTGATSGSETVYLYDWSSGSYPYGTFVALYSGNVPTGYTTTEISVPNLNRFIDPEGTAYLLIQTNVLAGGAELNLDRMQLIEKN